MRFAELAVAAVPARWARRALAALLGTTVAATGMLSLAGGTAGAVGGYQVTAAAGLSVRSGPGTGFGIVGHLARGAAVDISCQTHSGNFVNGSDVWDQIGPGYVTDYYVSTRAFDAYTPGIPVCGAGPAAPPPVPAVPAVPRTRLVVMGDSYSAGEGTYNAHNDPAPSVDYYPDTANPGDECHRSPAAYGPLLGVAPRDFVACSGATVTTSIEGRYQEGTQLRTLDAGVRTVIISLGGNDVGFGDVLGNCTSLAPDLIPGLIPFPFIGTTYGHCKTAVDRAMGKIPATMDALYNLYGQILSLTHGAQLLVVGYPRLFPPGGFAGCNHIEPDRQVLMNSAADALNDGLKKTVDRTPGATFVYVIGIFAGHEVCGAAHESYINDLQLNVPGRANCPDDRIVNHACSQSYHPTAPAYKVEADALRLLIEHKPLATLLPPFGPFQAPPPPPPSPPAVILPPGSTGPSYRYFVQGTCGPRRCVLLKRNGPGSAHTSPGRFREGDAVDIVCQDQGQAVSQPGGRTSDIWDRLLDGSWVADLYVSTPNVNAFSPPIPQCPPQDRASVGGGSRQS